jgi:hypothetical protein
LFVPSTCCHRVRKKQSENSVGISPSIWYLVGMRSEGCELAYLANFLFDASVSYPLQKKKEKTNSATTSDPSLSPRREKKGSTQEYVCAPSILSISFLLGSFMLCHRPVASPSTLLELNSHNHTLLGSGQAIFFTQRRDLEHLCFTNKF